MERVLQWISSAFKEAKATDHGIDVGQATGTTWSGAAAAYEVTGCADALPLDVLQVGNPRQLSSICQLQLGFCCHPTDHLPEPCCLQ
jgi:hypothetical protein